MTPQELLMMFQTGRALLDFALTQLQVAQQNGTLTQEQKDAILAEAQLTDAQVDQAIAQAKARIAAQASKDA